MSLLRYKLDIIEPASNTDYPIYHTIEDTADPITPQEVLPSSAPFCHKSLNPMYSSIDDLEFSRPNSFSLGQSSCSLERDYFSQQGISRGQSVADLLERTSSGNSPAHVPLYSMIVPRHLRKKSKTSMDIEN